MRLISKKCIILLIFLTLLLALSLSRLRINKQYINITFGIILILLLSYEIITEIGENLMRDLMGGEGSLEKYVRYLDNNKSELYIKKLAYCFIFFINIFLFFVLIYLKNGIYKCINNKQILISRIDYRSVPSNSHYLAIKNTLGSR